MPIDTTPIIPKLSPGIGWHLGEDGKWAEEKISADVLETAKFTNYLTIFGYRASVFETPEGDLWAQKTDLSKLAFIASKITNL